MLQDINLIWHKYKIRCILGRVYIYPTTITTSWCSTLPLPV